MKIGDVLKSVGRLYIETAPLIYYVEANPTYIDRMDAIIEAIETVPIKAMSCSMVLTEVLVYPLKQGDAALAQKYRTMLKNNTDFALVPITTAISEMAAKLRARYNMRTPDALHVATAIESKCDAFLTNDKGIKRVTEIQILVLDELEL